jgi:hypothetical protein
MPSATMPSVFMLIVVAPKKTDLRDPKKSWKATEKKTATSFCRLAIWSNFILSTRYLVEFHFVIKLNKDSVLPKTKV